MKISLIFICTITFIDLASCIISFGVGEQYEYKYSGKVLTGLPDIDVHFAGFVMTCDVYIQHHHLNNYKLALKNVAFAKFHEKLDGPEPKNWRTLSTPTPAPIDPALVQFLEAPIEFIMMNGRINNIKISSHEPQWTGNIKRAVLDLFKIQTPLVDNGIQENIINNSSQYIPNYFETMEEGINGICESIYTINELPAYLIKDPTSWTAQLLHLKVCTGKKIYQIKKVRDVTKCKKINHYVSRTRMEKQVPAKTSITNIVGCGLSKQSIMLHGVIQEGESLHNMDGLNTEPMVTGFQRILHLQEVRSVMTKLPDIDQPRSMDTVVYEFALKSDSVPQQTIAASLAKGTSPPLASWQSFKTPEIENAISQLHTESIKADVINKLKGIAADLSNDEHVADKQVTSQLMSVVHVFTTLTNGDIHDLHRDIKALAGIDQDMRDTIMDLWLDIATMAGTTHSVLFLKQIIETEDVTSFRSMSTIMTLGHYIRTPTVDHLKYFFTIVKSPVVLRNKMIKHNAIHNFANMINKACIAYEEPKHFPTHTFGEFCSSATSQLITTYVPYIIKQLRNANDTDDKEAYIIALATMGHQTVLPILLPIIEGKVSGYTASIRIMSILTLNTVVEKHRDVLLPVYTVILFNHYEERNIRIAALSMILKAEPDFTLMQRLAVSTWYENDPEMAKFIFSTLKFLSEKEFETIGSREKIVEMAKAVLPLAKPVPGILFYSSNHFISEYLNDLYVGYEHHSTFTFAPQGNTLFSKIIYFLDKIQLPVVELAFNLKGEKTLFEQLHHEFSTLLYGVKKNNSDIANKIHAEWKKIIQDMGIKEREDIPFHAALCFNLFDDVMAHVGADQISLNHLKSNIQSVFRTVMKDPKANMRPLCNKELKFNFIKVFNLLPTEIITSSDLGVPIFSETHAPHLLSLKGHIQLSNCNATIPTFELALNTKLIGDWYTYTGILVPTTKEIVLSSVAEHRSFNIPMKFSFTANPFSGRMVLDLVPTVDINATSVDIFHYHVKPFTCIRKITDFTPLTLHPDNKLIQSKSMTNKYIKNIGNTTGIAFDAILEVDNDLIDMTTVIDRFALYKYNPVNILKFFFTDTGMKLNGMPSNRLTKLTLLYNPSTSSTKHMTLENEIAIATRHGPQHNPIQYKFQHTPIFKLIEAPLTQATSMEKNLVKALTKLKAQNKNIVLSTLTNIHLKGDVSKTYRLGFTGGLDLGKRSKKWMIHMELMTNASQNIHVCLNGDLQQPNIPFWDIEHLLTSNITFTFKNDIGFGQDCGEYKINLNGIASVSDIQKSLSTNSRAAQLCKQAGSFGGSLSRRQGQHGILSQHAACQMQREQAATLDHLKLYANFIQLPPTAPFYQEVFESYIKLSLLPKIEPPSWFYKPISNMSKSYVQCEFNTEQNVVTLKLISTANQVVVKHLRLPSVVHGIIPMIATKTPVDQLNEALMGHPLNPTCHVSETGQIQTFDRHLYTYKMDDCYHVLSADCTGKFSFSVLVKETAGMKYAKIFHINNQFWLQFPLVYFNGLQLEIRKNSTRTLNTMDNHFVYTISRSLDDVFSVDTPIFVVEYNGYRIQVRSKQLKITGQLCGLCGDNNKDSRFDLKSPTNCVYKSDLLSALSYRHQTPKCPALPMDRMDRMAAEEAYCASAMIHINHHSQFQPVIGSHAKHFIIKNLKGQICISKLPLYFCLPSFIPKSNIYPMIPYTCITHPSKKVVKHYKQKVNSGAILPELNMLKTHITIPTKIPQYCSKD